MYRYIGNKTKITDEILNDIKKIIGTTGTVADIMCGTASVSRALKNEGYNVIASDVMTYSYYHAMVDLLLDEPPDFDKLEKEESFLKNISKGYYRYIKVIEFLNSLEPTEGYFFKEFSPDGNPANGEAPRKYFTSNNAKKIDAIMQKIKEWETKQIIDNYELALLKHDLILSVNPIANISGTYGHFHAKFITRALDPLIMKANLNQDLFIGLNSKSKHQVFHGYAEELAPYIKADLCYIDPPYMKRQYAANYHILETIARGDEPEAVGVSGLRPWRDQYSNFCSKVKIRNSFRAIFSQMDCPNFLISYSEDGLLSVEELMELFSEFGEVHTRKFLYKRFRSNQSMLNKEIYEYLFWIKKKS
jgi:adenine-specific DNA-methyltransferase